MENISKDTLIQYYLKENHTHKECLEYFKVTSWQFYKILHEYNLSKPTTKEFLSRISRAEFYNYYVLQNHSMEDTEKHFNITHDILAAVVKYYNINKNQSQLNERDTARAQLYERISSEMLKDLYLTQKMKAVQICETLNITHWDLLQLLQHYNIKKFKDYKYPRNNTQQFTFTKDELIRLYIEENEDREKCAELLHCNQTQIIKALKLWNIHKGQEQIWLQVKQNRIKDRGYLLAQSAFDKLSPLFQSMYTDVEKSKTFLDVTPRYTIRQLIDILQCTNMTILHWLDRLNLRDYVDFYYSRSHYEDEIYAFLTNFIPEVDIQKNCRGALNNKYELDLYIPKQKIGIEFNGDYWHSELHKDKKYHLEKSKYAESQGIRLIHIYEHEWNDITCQKQLKSLLKIACGYVPQKIYARQCEIREISNKEAKIFNDANHLQKHRNAQVTYGLFYQDELVQLMSFSKTKYNRNLKSADEWEIIRGCPGSNNIVVGGVGRLFKHFIKEYNPSKIFSYCDFNKFDGRSYEAIGMKFIGYTSPDMKWLMPGGIVIMRNPRKHKELQAQAQARIWGAGSKKYIWEKPL